MKTPNNKTVKDFKYKKDITVKDFVNQLSSIGFQATELDKCVEVIKNMKKGKAKIILQFTSNMGTSGLRGLFAYLAKIKFMEIVICTAGAIEEDIIKANNQEFYIGSFDADDKELHEKGLNRIGNILVPNKAYEKFEDLINPILEDLYKEKKMWDSTELIFKIGSYLKDENSFVYQCHKNNIPIFCPSIIDGAIGLQLNFFKQKHKDFLLEGISDLNKILSEVAKADKKGVISLGGGVGKHLAIMASLMDGGMDFAVYLTTAKEYAGSLSGAPPKEGMSWGKIKDKLNTALLHGDVTITFPLIITKFLEDTNE